MADIRRSLGVGMLARWNRQADPAYVLCEQWSGSFVNETGNARRSPEGDGDRRQTIA